MSVRVRFAPSPTGPLHIGGVRTALYNYLFAKKNKGVFLLRIEDTDQNRLAPGAEKYICNSLKWFKINPDESPEAGGNYGPYRQSERIRLYKSHIQKLINAKAAYLAFDTHDELKALRLKSEAIGEKFIYNWRNRDALKNSMSLSPSVVKELIDKRAPYTVRLRSYSNGQNAKVPLFDTIRGEMNVDVSLLDDKILLKQDGLPTYHFANVVDDHLMEISHVIRGEEWLPSLAFHVLLYKAFGWTAPAFAHVPLILKPTGKGKLSKRDGDKFGFPVFPLAWGKDIIGFKEAGYLPNAVSNYLALLGWSPGGEQELFSDLELIKLFSLEKITKAGGRFNPERCKWFNQQHLKQAKPELIENEIKKLINKRKVENKGGSLALISKLIQPRINLLTDIWGECHFFFIAPKLYDESAVKKHWNKEATSILSSISVCVKNTSGKKADEIGAEIKGWAEKKDIKIGMIMAPLRIALVGALRGPGIFDVCFVLGARECVKRIETAISNL
jgi:glutamyl-tRNA synthetase